MNRRTLAAAALVAIGTVGVTSGVVIALADEGKKRAGVDAQGRPIIQVDLKAPTRPPHLPAEATRPTPEGAKAFVLYYFDALNYSLAHLDTELLAHDTGAGCKLCTGYLLGIARWKGAGARLEGGLTVPASLAIGPFSTTSPVTFLATYLTSPATVHNRNGTTQDYPGGRTRGGLAVLYANGRWQMTTIVLDSTKEQP